MLSSKSSNLNEFNRAGNVHSQLRVKQLIKYQRGCRTRELKSDGRLDTIQTLHSLNQAQEAVLEIYLEGEDALPSVKRSNFLRSTRLELQEVAGQLHPQNAGRRKANSGDKIGTTSAFRSNPSDANN